MTAAAGARPAMVPADERVIVMIRPDPLIVVLRTLGLFVGLAIGAAGTLWAITSDSPAAQALIEFLKSPIANEVWMAQGGFLTPHKGVNGDLYADETVRAQGDILLGATTFRFDGSDLMPGGVGAGTFWTGMVDYAGGKDAAAVAGEIQASWEALK